MYYEMVLTFAGLKIYFNRSRLHLMPFFHMPAHEAYLGYIAKCLKFSLAPSGDISSLREFFQSAEYQFTLLLIKVAERNFHFAVCPTLPYIYHTNVLVMQ